MKMQPVSVARPALLIIVLAIATACVPPAQLGRRGELAFYYEAAGQLMVPDFDRPVAAGAKVDVAVGVPVPGELPHVAEQGVGYGRLRYTLEQVQNVKVSRATSSAPDVLGVVEQQEHVVTLRARAPGKARLRVVTQSGWDEVQLRVDHCKRVELLHWAPDVLGISPWSFAMVSGGQTHLYAALYAADGNRLVGYGLGGILRPQPAARARVLPVTRQQDWVSLELREPGVLRLKPRGSLPWVLQVAAPAEVVGLTLAFCDGDGCTGLGPVTVGNEQLVFVKARLRDGRLALGLEGLLEVRSLTPRVCAVESASQLGLDGFRMVYGVSEGSCKLRMSFKNLRRNVSFPVRRVPTVKPRPG